MRFSFELAFLRNPGLGWYHYISMVLPRWMIPFTHPIYLLSLRYPHWFSSPQGRAIVAFGAEKGELQRLERLKESLLTSFSLRWWHEMTPYHKPACEGDNDTLPGVKAFHESRALRRSFWIATRPGQRQLASKSHQDWTNNPNNEPAPCTEALTWHRAPRSVFRTPTVSPSSMGLAPPLRPG